MSFQNEISKPPSEKGRARLKSLSYWWIFGRAVVVMMIALIILTQGPATHRNDNEVGSFESARQDRIA